MSVRTVRLQTAAFLFGAALLPVPVAAAPQPVAVFQDGQTAPAAVMRNIGEVRVHICRRAWDATPADDEALNALRERAAALNANGLIAVHLDRTRASLTDRNCWQRLAVSGDAVVFAPTPVR